MKKEKKKVKRVKVYKWHTSYVDGKLNERILGAAHPGCCKQ